MTNELSKHLSFLHTFSLKKYIFSTFWDATTYKPVLIRGKGCHSIQTMDTARRSINKNFIIHSKNVRIGDVLVSQDGYPNLTYFAYVWRSFSLTLIDQTSHALKLWKYEYRLACLLEYSHDCLAEYLVRS